MKAAKENTTKAINLALENGLDLVEVAPNATPPVCRIMDYGKYKFEQEKKRLLQKYKEEVTLKNDKIKDLERQQ